MAELYGATSAPLQSKACNGASVYNRAPRLPRYKGYIISAGRGFTPFKAAVASYTKFVILEMSYVFSGDIKSIFRPRPALNGVYP